MSIFLVPFKQPPYGGIEMYIIIIISSSSSSSSSSSILFWPSVVKIPRVKTKKDFKKLECRRLKVANIAGKKAACYY